MHQNKKLCTSYFLIIMSFTILCALVFLVMNKIERIASRLETRIYRRDLSHIIDKDYSQKKEKKYDDSDQFLNELTDFYFKFSENTISYKKQLDTFMEKRNNVIYRFNSSSIKIYDLTVIPNKNVKQYELKEHAVPIGQDPLKYIKQIPFSRQMKFKSKDARALKKNIFFMCTARLSVSSSRRGMLYASFVSTEDQITPKDLMPYKIHKNVTNININRIIRMNKPKNFRIMIKGYTSKIMKLHKVEAYCMNFTDVNNEEVSKSK